MIHNNKEVLKYWNQENVESMYDKYLLKSEIELIKKFIPIGSKILDAGCGEGEGTLQYSSISNVNIHAADFSDTRLNKARKRLISIKNVKLLKIDFLDKYVLDSDYDVIISQRFLINFMKWDLQEKVILNLISRLKVNGLFLILEGSKDGVDELNDLRALFNLDPIPVKWHNLFFKDENIETLLTNNGLKIVKKDGLGEYFLLTRGIRPIFEKELNWNTSFNKIVASNEIKEILSLGEKLSRLKLWVTQKKRKNE